MKLTSLALSLIQIYQVAAMMPGPQRFVVQPPVQQPLQPHHILQNMQQQNQMMIENQIDQSPSLYEVYLSTLSPEAAPRVSPEIRQNYGAWARALLHHHPQCAKIALHIKATNRNTNVFLNGRSVKEVVMTDVDFLEDGIEMRDGVRCMILLMAPDTVPSSTVEFGPAMTQVRLKSSCSSVECRQRFWHFMAASYGISVRSRHSHWTHFLVRILPEQEFDHKFEKLMTLTIGKPQQDLLFQAILDRIIKSPAANLQQVDQALNQLAKHAIETKNWILFRHACNPAGYHRPVVGHLLAAAPDMTASEFQTAVLNGLFSKDRGFVLQKTSSNNHAPSIQPSDQFKKELKEITVTMLRVGTTSAANFLSLLLLNTQIQVQYSKEEISEMIELAGEQNRTDLLRTVLQVFDPKLQGHTVDVLHLLLSTRFTDDARSFFRDTYGV